MKRIVLASLLLATPAFADDAPKPPEPTVTLTQPELQSLLDVAVQEFLTHQSKDALAKSRSAAASAIGKMEAAFAPPSPPSPLASPKSKDPK